MKHALASLVLTLLALPAAATEPAPNPAPAPDNVRPLTTTGEWLELQRSGAAQGAPNALPGEAMELIYQRFIGSFGNGTPTPAPYGSQAR